MRRLLLTAVAALALAIAAPGGTAAHSATATASKVCHRGVPAQIGGKSKCLQAGEYCATRYERQYERHGFECSTRYRPPRLRRR